MLLFSSLVSYRRQINSNSSILMLGQSFFFICNVWFETLPIMG